MPVKNSDAMQHICRISILHGEIEHHRQTLLRETLLHVNKMYDSLSINTQTFTRYVSLFFLLVSQSHTNFTILRTFRMQLTRFKASVAIIFASYGLSIEFVCFFFFLLLSHLDKCSPTQYLIVVILVFLFNSCNPIIFLISTKWEKETNFQSYTRIHKSQLHWMNCTHKMPSDHFIEESFHFECDLKPEEEV